MGKDSTPEPAPGSIGLLTSRLAARDEEAFRELHERFFDRLYQFLLVVTRGRADEAQEAVQQTWLRVVRYVRVFDTEEALWDWLKVLARSAARDAGRKQQRYVALLQKFALRRQGCAYAREQASGEENRLRSVLEECLEELDPADRQLIENKYVEGLTVKELSALTGLTEKAIESRLLRARRGLRELVLHKLRTL